MALPTIIFGSGGSDSAASGSGGTAVTGTGAAVTNGSGSVTISDAVALGGVATDGSAVLYIATASGRRFSKITAISGSSGAWTVTVEDTVWTAGTALSWAIGGKRLSPDDTGSRLLFSSDAKPGWTIQGDHTVTFTLTAPLACTAAGSSSGFIIFRGDSTTTRTVITTATNNVSLLSGGLQYWRLENLKLTSSAATKTSSYGINFNAANTGITVLRNCELGDATNTLQQGIFRTGTAQPDLELFGTDIHHCIGTGMNGGGGGNATLSIFGGSAHHNGAGGIQVIFSTGGTLEIAACKVYANTGIGIEYVDSGGLSIGTARVIGNTIHGNSSDGLKIGNANQMSGAVIVNNEITANGGTGINYAGVGSGDTLLAVIDYNNFGTGALANTSGAVSGFTMGPNSLTIDPGYANAASGDFTPSNTATQVGFP